MVLLISYKVSYRFFIQVPEMGWPNVNGSVYDIDGCLELSKLFDLFACAVLPKFPMVFVLYCKWFINIFVREYIIFFLLVLLYFF